MNYRNRFFLCVLILVLTLFPVMLCAQNDDEEYDEELYGPETHIIWENPVKGAAFSHKTHTIDNDLSCIDCHTDPFLQEARASEDEEDFTMDSMADGMYCGMCHDGNTAFSTETNCTKCHIGVRGVKRLEEETE